MQLLVSVRSAAEAAIALAGGADIIDAKEPSRGALGPVSREMLRQILGVIPENHPVSIALGDAGTVAQVLGCVSGLPARRHQRMYLKLGFAGTRDPKLIHELLQVALEAVAQRSIDIVAVAYADAAHAGSPPPEVVCDVAERAGVVGVLVDTYQKSSGNLLTWLQPSRLARLLAKASAARLLTAVAGGLGPEQLSTVNRAGPDIVGFRGAACDGGREGQLSEARIRFLRQRLAEASSVFIHPGAATPAGRWQNAR